jgi:hypothetical protein
MESIDQVVDKYHHNAFDEKQFNNNLNSKNEMVYLHKVHELDLAEKKNSISLKCCKMLESCEDSGVDDNARHKN